MSKQAVLAAICDAGAVLTEHGGSSAVKGEIIAPEGMVWASTGEHVIEFDFATGESTAWRYLAGLTQDGVRECGGCGECAA